MIRRRLVVFLTISITAIFWLCAEDSPLTAGILKGQRKQQPTLARIDVRFEPKSALNGITADGFRFSSETWEASDGAAIFLRRQYCRSAKNAERALRERANSATKIFETNLLRNKKGGATSGRRIVVSFDSAMKERPQMILWTEHDMLYAVESASFEHALLFEKMLPSL